MSVIVFRSRHFFLCAVGKGSDVLIKNGSDSWGSSAEKTTIVSSEYRFVILQYHALST